MESTYLGTPVLTSNISSTKELGILSPNEILLCNPKNIDDIVEKMIYLIQNLNKYECTKKTLFNQCYNINNSSLINKIYLIENIDKNITISNKLHPVYEMCLKNAKLFINIWELSLFKL